MGLALLPAFTALDLTTEEALANFEATTPVEVVAFGASDYGGLGWATPADLPEMGTVGELRAFLRAEDEICLVDFEAKSRDSAS